MMMMNAYMPEMCTHLLFQRNGRFQTTPTGELGEEEGGFASLQVARLAVLLPAVKPPSAPPHPSTHSSNQQACSGGLARCTLGFGGAPTGRWREALSCSQQAWPKEAASQQHAITSSQPSGSIPSRYQ